MRLFSAALMVVARIYHALFHFDLALTPLRRPSERQSRGLCSAPAMEERTVQGVITRRLPARHSRVLSPQSLCTAACARRASHSSGSSRYNSAARGSRRTAAVRHARGA